MGQMQYRAEFTRGEDGSATVTKRKGRRLWMEPELTDEAWKALATDLSREIRDALTARDAVIGQGNLLDYCHWLYVQGKTPDDLSKPWGSDQNSYLVTEAVDSLFARLVQAAFPKQEVVCTVGGWGEASKQKAPLVEEFLDFTFRQEEPDAQLSVALTIFQSLIEDAGILEVTEGYEIRATLEDIDIAPQVDADGGVILDHQNYPTPQLHPDTGEPIPQTDPNGPSIKAKYRQLKPRLTGPQYDVISCRDFLFLPGHAKNKQGSYGYAKRFYRRVAELTEKAQAGIYQPDRVKELGTQQDRQVTAEMTARGIDVVPQYDEHTAEKQLWEFYVRRDLDGDGYEEWYCGTLSVINDVMIRLILDDFGRGRCLSAVPFPRPDSIYGYNFISDKMASIAEEHAALRNTATDRSTLASNPPMTQIEGGLWDPNVQPFGTGLVIPVKDHNEVKQLQVSDVPMSNVDLRRECLAAKERVTGVNDVSGSSVSNTQAGTATRDNLIAAAGAVRIETALNFLREFLADLWDIRRRIYIRKLESEQDGEDISHGLSDRLQIRGVEAADKITADDLKGRFYFKPVGSVASADPARRRADSAQAFMGMAELAKFNPMLQQALATPEASMAIMMTWARDNDVVDKQAFVGALRKIIQQQAEAAQQQQQLQQQQALMPGMMGQPGRPMLPGAPQLRQPGMPPPTEAEPPQTGTLQ